MQVLRSDLAAARARGSQVWERFTRLGDARGLAETRRVVDGFGADPMGRANE